jgi:hypothetical protein
MTRNAIILVVWTLIGISSSALSAATNRSVRILFVGNSYTYADDIPWITTQLAASPNHNCPLETEMVAFPGATLRTHWEKGEVLAKMKRLKWDFVVMQEQSLVPIDNPADMRRYARLFSHEIRINGATPVLFVTWPRKNHAELQTQITEVYMTTAKDINALLAPVGPAWQMALAKDSTLALFHQDQSHPSPLGSYIGACIFYSIFCGKNPEGLAGTVYTRTASGHHTVVSTLSREQATLLQRVAWQAIQSNTISFEIPRQLLPTK